MTRVFSGMQPTGHYHIGNYVGALKNWAAMQYQHECYYCIVDMHAITVPYEPAELPARVIDAAATVLACGVSPEHATLFVQSHVPEHTELCWLLTCITPLGNLTRMTQFKEKSRRQQENVQAGLMNYPILMAADIMLYKAGAVPVGEDQVQHLELTRDLVRRFNLAYGETFPEPQPILTRVPRVMAINDPEKKMSKSLPGSFVALADEPDEIRAKLRKAVTDVGPAQAGVMSPGVQNLFGLLEAFASAEVNAAFRADYAGGHLRYSDLKTALAEAMISALAPIREKRAELLAQPDTLRSILLDGAGKARIIARETVREAKDRMGLGY